MDTSLLRKKTKENRSMKMTKNKTKQNSRVFHLSRDRTATSAHERRKTQVNREMPHDTRLLSSLRSISILGIKPRLVISMNCASAHCSASRARRRCRNDVLTLDDGRWQCGECQRTVVELHHTAGVVLATPWVHTLRRRDEPRGGLRTDLSSRLEENEGEASIRGSDEPAEVSTDR